MVFLAEFHNLVEIAFSVELNPVRAQQFKRPETRSYNAAWFHRRAQVDGLMSLTELKGVSDPELTEKPFWTQLFWRGSTILTK